MEITDQCSENSETLDIGKRVWGSRISIPCVSYVDARNRDPWATLKLSSRRNISATKKMDQLRLLIEYK